MPEKYRIFLYNLLCIASPCRFFVKRPWNFSNINIERCGTPCRIRTCDNRLRRPMLYPAELKAHNGIIMTGENRSGKKRNQKYPRICWYDLHQSPTCLTRYGKYSRTQVQNWTTLGPSIDKGVALPCLWVCLYCIHQELCWRLFNWPCTSPPRSP